MQEASGVGVLADIAQACSLDELQSTQVAWATAAQQHPAVALAAVQQVVRCAPPYASWKDAPPAVHTLLALALQRTHISRLTCSQAADALLALHQLHVPVGELQVQLADHVAAGLGPHGWPPHLRPPSTGAQERPPPLPPHPSGALETLQISHLFECLASLGMQQHDLWGRLSHLVLQDDARRFSALELIHILTAHNVSPAAGRAPSSSSTAASPALFQVAARRLSLEPGTFSHEETSSLLAACAHAGYQDLDLMEALGNKISSYPALVKPQVLVQVRGTTQLLVACTSDIACALVLGG